MLEDLLKYFKKSKRNDPERKIRKLSKKFPKDLRKRALNETIRDILDLAIYNFEKGELALSAENLELAADAYKMITGKKGKPYKEYTGMAKDIRDLMRREKEGKLESRYTQPYPIAILAILFFLVAMFFFSGNLMGFVVSENTYKSSNLGGFLLLTIAIVLFGFVLKKIKKEIK
jgi:hypothetical protein